MEKTEYKAPPQTYPPASCAPRPSRPGTHRRSRKAWAISPHHSAGLSLQGQSAAGSWVQFWAQEPCCGGGGPGGAPAIPYGALGNPPPPLHLPAPPLGLEVLALPEDKTGQRVMLELR